MKKKTKDAYCSDGVISHGERLVRKGGIVFFGKYKIQEEDLIPWVGKYVFVSVNDYFFIDVYIGDANNYTSTIINKAKVKSKKK